MRVCDVKSSGQRSKRSKRRLKDRLCFRPAYRDEALAFGNQIGTRSSGTMMISQGNIARSSNYRKGKSTEKNRLVSTTLIGFCV